MKLIPRSLRLTLPQWAALDDCARADRLKTGNLATVADVLREAAKAACEARGVPWPR